VQPPSSSTQSAASPRSRDGERGHEYDEVRGDECASECGDECGNEGGNECADGPGNAFANPEGVEPGTAPEAEPDDERGLIEVVADTDGATASKAGKIRLQNERDRATGSGCQQNWRIVRMRCLRNA
jgi:hypothetical protein